MKVTKQQKVLGGLMVVGLLLVGADQLGLLPGSAAASEDAPASEYTGGQAAAPAPPIPVAAAAPAAATVSVAQRLREVSRTLSDNTMRDAFAVGPAWITPLAEAPRIDSAAHAIEQFKQSHKLTGVLSGSGRDHASVDNKIVAIGQSVDGFTLVSVSHRSATFQAGEARVVLTMGAAGSGAVAGAQ
jgi:hypothetical protein